MNGRSGVWWAVLGVAWLLASAPWAAALEPMRVNDDWMAKVEAELTASAELRLSQDFSAGGTEQPYTKRKGGYFESLIRLGSELYREDESVKFRVEFDFFGLGDPGNGDLAGFFDGLSTHGYDGDISLEEAWVQFGVSEGNWTRLGIQRFRSDHAGLIYNDSDRGAVYHGTLGEVGFNLAYFAKSFDDAVSQLNTENGRPWHVMIANLEVPVGTVQVIPSFHFSIDRTGPTETNVGYVGASAAGQVSVFQVLTAYYWAFGEQTGGMVNPADQTVDAHLLLINVALPLMEGKVIPSTGFIFASGDDDPLDRRARGFDAIYDYIEAWGFNDYFIRPRKNLGPATLCRAHSGLFTMRDFDEPANFINPGIAAFNLGLTTKWTDEFTTDLNAGPVYLPQTDTPELVLGRGVGHELAYRMNANATWQLNETATLKGGVAACVPENGAQAIFGGNNNTAWDFVLMLVIKV
ncbi:MAG: hypothetical protein AMS14_06235 [Planctomycetes bacterium DG_20]|nr:MAG: hypothetical protein AMS14_06235 [Planctomycetes bacterium DG_20]